MQNLTGATSPLQGI